MRSTRGRARLLLPVLPLLLVAGGLPLVATQLPGHVSAAWTTPVADAGVAQAPITLAPLSAAEEAALAAVPTEPVAHRAGVTPAPGPTASPTTSAPRPAAASTRPAPSTAPARSPAAAVAAVAPSPAPAPPPVLPLGVRPPGSQVVTVVAASARATSAKLTAWERRGDGWVAVLGPVTATVGAAGVGQASESTSRTPAGTFSLTEAFGRGDPGTALPYRVVDGDDWWVSDVASPRYNRYAQCVPGSCDFDERAGENLLRPDGVYDNAVVIDYNRGGRPGAGSAFFLHVSNGAPTAGCVAIGRADLTALLRWLAPSASPVIAIGVG
ncbi:L,D-transpeptidase family protein [Modestobacter sp. NPDC049651]|uniref:L,D-transpeptidase family protein n=1 Tax=unclassified Modestobacter TaxID=2643866 RepID=UPI003400F464